MYIVQGVPKVYGHTFGFIPPPWFIFEGCRFAIGILYPGGTSTPAPALPTTLVE